MTTTGRATEFMGVYDADGGVRGEITYVVGHLLGRAHCSLCDITHSPVRRKPEWDAMVARLGVPFTLVHRNEMAADVAASVAGHPLAIVLAKVDGEWSVALSAKELDSIDGDIAGLETVLRRTIASQN